MPMEMAPERFTFAFSSRMTLAFGFFRRARIAAIGPAVQTVGITEGYYLFYAAPYVLTLGLLIYSSSRTRTLAGAPNELSISR